MTKLIITNNGDTITISSCRLLEEDLATFHERYVDMFSTKLVLQVLVNFATRNEFVIVLYQQTQNYFSVNLY